jgi:hypothetical protein
MRQVFSVRLLLTILSILIAGSAFAQERRPLIYYQFTPKLYIKSYSSFENGFRHSGLSLTWTFFVDNKNENLNDIASGGKPSVTSKSAVAFSSLEAALSDPRVSPADKLLIKNKFIPQRNRLNGELKQLNLEAMKKSPQGKPLFDDATVYRRFNNLLDQHAADANIQKLQPQALRD